MTRSIKSHFIMGTVSVKDNWKMKICFFDGNSEVRTGVRTGVRTCMINLTENVFFNLKKGSKSSDIGTGWCW